MRALRCFRVRARHRSIACEPSTRAYEHRRSRLVALVAGQTCARVCVCEKEICRPSVFVFLSSPRRQRRLGYGDYVIRAREGARFCARVAQGARYVRKHTHTCAISHETRLLIPRWDLAQVVVVAVVAVDAHCLSRAKRIQFMTAATPRALLHTKPNK